MQDRETANKKSEDVEYLRDHVLTIIGAMWIPAAVIFYIAWGGAHGILGAAFFAVINGIVHAITDWNIWKGYKLLVFKRFQKECNKKGELLNVTIPKKRIIAFKKNKEYAEDPWFYNTIGLDRLIHVSTIIVLYFWMMKGV